MSGTAMSSSTDYLPLPDRHSFRLLTVQQVDGTGLDDGSRLLCSIENKSLSSDSTVVEYVALSYTWEAPVDTPEFEEAYREPIQIRVSHDGGPRRTMHIGRNLFEALVEIHKKHWNSYIWVDAICIDQSNSAERSEQVGIMDKIYSKSQFTICWAGVSGPDEADVRWLYGPFAAFLRDAKTTSQTLENTIIPQGYPALSGRFLVEETSSDTYEYIYDFAGEEMSIRRARILALARHLYRRRYFWRRWVMQEIVLPPAFVLLMGSNLLSPEAHIDLFHWFISDPFARRYVEKELGIPFFQFPNVLGRSIYLGENDAKDWEGLYEIWGANCAATRSLAMFTYLVNSNTIYKSSDPRDVLYSVLGIVRLLAPSPWIDTFMPDYESSTGDVFTKFAASIIRDFPNMMILFRFLPCYHNRQIEGLPSWVPDFSSDAMRPSTLLDWSSDGSVGDGKTDVFPFRDETTSAVEILGKELHLYAIYCGEIRGQASHYGIGMGNEENMVMEVKLLLFLLKFAYETGPEYVDGQPVLKAAVRTVMWDPELRNDENAENALKLFKNLILLNITKLRKVASEKSPDERDGLMRLHDEICNLLGLMYGQYGLVSPSELQDLQPSIVDTFASEGIPPKHTETVVFDGALGNVMAMRNVFRTDNNYLGLCSQGTQPGDQLWVLCCASVPHILRPLPEKGKYLTLGEARVHGMMNGEFFERNPAKSPHKITIV